MPSSLVLLGTAGGPRVKSGRAAPSQTVVTDNGFYVIDAGNGVARQAVQAGLDLRDLRGVFITHHHCDHNVDVVTLPLLAWASGLNQPVAVVGPPATASMVNHLVAANSVDIDFRTRGEQRPDFAGLLAVTEMQPAQNGIQVVFEDDTVRVSSTLVDHGMVKPAYAFRIDTNDRSYVISGDTKPCDSLVELAQGADVLVHEVMYEDALDKLVSETNAQRLADHLLDTHTPVSEIGQLAQRAGVGTLVLSHLIPSYPEVPDEVWLGEVSSDFEGEVVVARDLLVV